MQAFGRIAGWWGLVALILSLVSWKLAGTTHALVEAGVGIALLLFYVVTNRGAAATNVKEQANKRAGFFWTTSAVMAGAVLVLLVGLNFITAKRGKPIDLTNKKIYSLAPQTQQALKGLKEPVKAIGFMATDHGAYDVLKGLFDKYASESDKFTYEFKDPKKSIELNAKYQIKEGQTSVILTKGSGANESHTALSVISEEDLTNSLLKLNASGTQKIYFLAGHGEWPITPTSDGVNAGGQAPSVSELKQSLEQEGYGVESLDLAASQNIIPADAAMLVVAHASEPFTMAQIGAIETYLTQGGRLLYFADWDASSNLEPTLAKFGIEIEKGVVADALNPGNPFQAIGFPTEHEVSSILKQLNANMLIETSRGLVPLKEGTLPGVTVTPVLLSSPKSWIETTPEDPDPSDGERLGSIPLVMASTMPTGSAPEKRFDEARVLVFGDSALIIDANWGHEVIRNLVLNAFGWTSSQVQKITIRPPDRDISVIDISDSMMAQIRFLSIIGLPQLLIALGIAIRVSRRSK